MPAPRLVLVDDDIENRRLLREVLEGQGIDVLGEAADGAEAIEVALATRPDVVLMDLEMPRVGGFEATRELSRVLPRTVVIILTVYDEPLPTRSAAEVGAYAYLVKGCSAGLIRDVVFQAWRRSTEIEVMEAEA